MVAYAPNLSARNQKRGNKFASPGKGKPLRTKSLDRGTHIPTRELKTHINILDSFLAQPARCAGVAPKDLAAMTTRLAVLRKELAKRDELENQPLDSGALVSRLRRVAPRGTLRGLRVQLQS